MNAFTRLFRHLQKKSVDKLIAAYPDNPDIDKTLNVSYLNDTNPLHLLDVYCPKQHGEKLPVILEVHGGAYVSNTKDINACHGQYLASKGYAVVNMSYSLYPEADIRQAIKEIFTVREWIEKHNHQYAFDTNNVFLTGDSAGGHLVLLCGGVQANAETRRFVGIDTVKYPFQAIAATCPMGEFGNLTGSNGWFLKQLLSKLMKDQDYCEKVCYQSYVKDGFPPLLLLTTPEDDVLYEHTKAMHEWLSSKGFPHTYYEYSGKSNKLEHVFNVTAPWYEESIEANNDIVEFFKKHQHS